MQVEEASLDEVAQAEQLILPAFRQGLEELLRDRPDPRPQPSDDRAIFALADKAIRDYHAATARTPTLPRLSKVQYLEIRQRLYITHSALGPLGELLALEGVEDIHINGIRGGLNRTGFRRGSIPWRIESHGSNPRVPEAVPA